jgi:hypothetical protein
MEIIIDPNRMKLMIDIFDVSRNPFPKRKFFLSLVLALLCLAIGSSSSSHEITIRNLTEETIRFTLKPVHSRGALLEKSLKPGEIGRFPGEEPLDIDYEVKGKLVMNRLDPDCSYSFRYNENHELELFLGSHGRSDAPDLAPYVTTPMMVADKMLQMADVDKDDVVYDLGCGDGRILVLAAKKYGARGVGIDLDPQRIEESRANAIKEGIDDLVEFRLEDVMKSDISQATVVTLYLIPESNKLLRPILEKQLKPGTYVVSHNYDIPGWEGREIRFASLKDEKGEDHHIYVYLR